MDISNQKLDTTEITIRNNSKPDAKNLWKEIEDEDDEYQFHATIFSTDSTTESDETISVFKRVNITDLEKRKEVYGVCGECNEPDGLSEPVNSTDYLSSFQEPISSSSANPISECLDCELNELDLNQDDDE
ncbi:kinase-like domain-containing protein [Rhizophagus irregularis DAOM 181602=DAOM 197198]|nr:kinase-like domain-containing protein [Rhizophagus irregularis DAOM 181602=DAOM 197198]